MSRSHAHHLLVEIDFLMLETAGNPDRMKVCEKSEANVKTFLKGSKSKLKCLKVTKDSIK